jgi:hypothetical protein
MEEEFFLLLQMPTPVAAQVMHAIAFWGVIGEGGATWEASSGAAHRQAKRKPPYRLLS